MYTVSVDDRHPPLPPNTVRFSYKVSQKCTNAFVVFKLPFNEARRSSYFSQWPFAQTLAMIASIGYSIGEPKKNDPSDTGCWLFSFREACDYEEPVRCGVGESGKGPDRKIGAAKWEPRWGKMTAAQMLAHCSVNMQRAVGEVVPEKGALTARLMGRLVKPMVFRNEDPLRKNSPTAKSLIVADDRDLGKEREQLSRLIDKFAAGGAAGCAKNPHSFFGKMTPEEWRC